MYSEYLAERYVVRLLRPDRCDNFMRITWSAFGYNGLVRTSPPVPTMAAPSQALSDQSQAADGLHRDCLRTAHAIQTFISTRSPYVQQPVSPWLTSDYGLVSSRGGTMRRTITALITLTVLPALMVVATLAPRLMRSATKPPPNCDNDRHDAITKMLSTQTEEDCA